MPIGTRNDPTKVMMGASLVGASYESVESLDGNIAAGLCFRKNTSTGAYQVAASGAGPILGLSRGRSLGGAGTFSGMYQSPKGVLQLTGSFTPSVGAQVHINNTTGKGDASGGSATATAAIYEKVLLGGGVSEIDGSAIDVAIINFTSGF